MCESLYLTFGFLYGPLFSTAFFRYNMVRRDQLPEFKHRIRQIKIGHKSMATVWQIFVKKIFFLNHFKITDSIHLRKTRAQTSILVI